MNATDEVRVWKTKIITKGRTTRSSPKQPAKITFALKKRRTLQNIIYPTKAKQTNKKNKTKKQLIETASGGKSRVAYRPLSTLLNIIQLLKKFKMQSLLQ